MANSASAKKRANQAENRRQRNASQRSMMRTYVKRVISEIAAGNKETAQEAYKLMSPLLDKSATKGLVSKNKVARQKSRLNKQIVAMA
ncbi:MAG: 30S ribosomal protein S20 [Gammaproteobacteria bacterium]|nr:30S ribosomal protein S20 [Gammaproteobacteria bacterium]